MSLLRLTLVAVLSLAAIALPLIGLFKAPWYILLLVLALGFAVTQFAITSSETVGQPAPAVTIQPEFTPSPSGSAPTSVQADAEQLSRLTYRGANYKPVSSAPDLEEPGNETLSGKYRGCQWHHPIAATDGQATEAPTAEGQAPVRMYRGVKISQG